MSSSGFLQTVLAGFADSLQPVRDAVASPTAFAGFLKQFGWTLSDVNLAQITSALKDLGTLASNPSSLSLEQLTSDLISAGKVIRGIAATGAPAAFISTFPRELLDYLVYSAVATQVPGLFGILHFIGIFWEQRVAADTMTGRAEHVEFIVDWSRLGPLADQPLETIASTYGWGGAFDGDALVRSIGILVRGFGGQAGIYGADPQLVDQYYAHAAPASVGLRNVIISVPELNASVSSGSAAGTIKLAVLALPIPPNSTTAAAADGVAVMPVITGQAADTINLTDAITLTLSGDFLTRPVRAEFHPGSAIVRAATGDTHIDASVRLDAKAPPATPWLPIGNATSSSLRTVRGARRVRPHRHDRRRHGAHRGDRAGYGRARDRLQRGRQPDAGDGHQVADAKPDRNHHQMVEQDRLLAWRSAEDRDQHSGEQSLAGVATLQAIGFALGATSNGRLEFDAMLTGSTSIGPVQLEIQNVGLAVYIIPSANSSPPGALGNIDFGFGFKSPSGVGVAIDSSGLTGGGFLSHDDAASQYAGMLQLSYQAFQLQAFGLITTKLPTGPGYSMVAMVDATFPPIELVAGFTLNGVGGSSASTVR